MTGAFFASGPVAGPIELTTADIVFWLVFFTAMALGLPILAGAIAVVLYRRRTLAVDRSRRAAWVEFLKWAAIALGAQIVVAWLIQVFTGLT